MFKINDDRSIYITRGDAALLDLTAEAKDGTYTFRQGETVRFRVFERKNCSVVALIKDVTVTSDTDTVQIYLSGEDTRIGNVISRPTDYWYEVEIDPMGSPQTVIGYDEDGPKVFKLFPEGDDGSEKRPSGDQTTLIGKELHGYILDPDVVRGRSAYETALLYGFEGTEEEWIKQVTSEADRAEAAAKSAAKDAKDAATDEVTRLVGELGVTSELGSSEVAVISQKTVTELLLERMPRLNILLCDGYISVDTVSGTLTIPAQTELMTGDFVKVVEEDIVISFQEFTNTSGNYILYDKKNDTFEAYARWGMTSLDMSNYYYLCSVRRGFSGKNWKPSCDLSVPHYMDGRLFGCGIPTDLMPRLNIGVCYDYISIDNANGTITIPAKTELMSGAFRMVTSEDIVIAMKDMTDTSGNVILFNKTTKEFENIATYSYATIDISNYFYAFFVRRTADGLSFKSCADISTPYYVDGVLYGGGVSDGNTDEGEESVAAVSALPTLAIIGCYDFISIDNVNGTITIPANTELLTGNERIVLSEDAVISMHEITNTSGNFIIYNKTARTFENIYPWNWAKIDWSDHYYVFTVRRVGTTVGTLFKTHANISIPYYIDGVLYGGAGSDSSGGNDESSGGGDGVSSDNTKPKEFAELFYNSNKVEPFMFFTDPHLCQHEGDAWREEFDEYMSVLKGYYTESALTRVFCGGDWLGGTISDAAEACYRLGLADAKMREYFKEYYPIRGNHESNYSYDDSNSILNRSTIKNLMFRKEGKTYYTVDGDNSRFFIFDTQDESHTIFDDDYRKEQCLWFAEELKNNTAENIIMMMHMTYVSFDNETQQGTTVWNTPHQLTLIAKAFNERTSLQVNGAVLYDFTNAVGKVRFMMAGHTHGDCIATVNSIPTVITTHLRDGGIPTFDMCLVDYDSGKLHMVRVGTGENRTVDI